MVGKAQKSGEDEKEKGARRPSSPQFPPLFVFALSQFPRAYSLRPPHFRSNWVAFPKYSSSFCFEQYKKKEVKEEEKSSSTVGVFVILDNVSSLPSFMVT